jgi:hypothetical protein
VRPIGRAAFLLAAALAGCDAPRPENPGLWTLFDVQALYAGGAQPTDAIAIDAGLPGGVPLDTILASDGFTLAEAPSWAEGYPATYVTTEVWSNFDRVWVQPMYVPVTGWDAAGPKRVLDPAGSWRPIFSVGPESLFYSPFWQMIYVQVPEGTAYDQLTSTRQILDGGYVLHPSTGWVAALSPGDVTAPPSMPPGAALPGQGWLDGNPISFLKFPAAPFAFDAELVVAEVPIFHFVFVKEDGSVVAPGLPSVLGTGPLYSNTPAPIDNFGLPTARYSAYWRVYTVMVPATARVFAPPGSTAADALTAAGVTNDVPPYPDDILMPADAEAAQAVRDVSGRVAMAAGCFSSLATSTGQNNVCNYLDSQYKIETLLPGAAIVRTDVTVTCPLVSVNGKAVGQ